MATDHFYMTTTKMQVIAHRGLWTTPEEKNTFKAFAAAFENGFGVETDIRDHNGQVVIAHDMAHRQSRSFEDFLRLYRELNSELTLALNVKADGLQSPCRELLRQYSVDQYFVFDCAVPDLLSYHKMGLNFFSRHSDIEKEVVLYQEAKGVWLDELVTSWITESTVLSHLSRGKKVCLVSPELHGRPYKEAWLTYKNLLLEQGKLTDNRIMICTDHPIEAREYFSV